MRLFRHIPFSLIALWLILFTCQANADDVSIQAELATSTGQPTMVALNREQHLYDVTTTHGDLAIAFVIKNLSNHEIDLRDQLLPTFLGPGRFVLTAAWKWGDPLEPMAPPPIDYNMPAPGDPIPKPIVLRPSDSRRFLVPVSLRVDNVEGARKKGDVVLFWYVDVFDEKSKKLVGSAGGWFDLPKTH